MGKIHELTIDNDFGLVLRPFLSSRLEYAEPLASGRPMLTLLKVWTACEEKTTQERGKLQENKGDRKDDFCGTGISQAARIAHILRLENESTQGGAAVQPNYKDAPPPPCSITGERTGYGLSHPKLTSVQP